MSLPPAPSPLREYDDGYIMILTPDAEWLSDSERVYPVTIDPDVHTSTDTPKVLDTYAKENVNTTNTYYNEVKNYVGVKDGKIHRAFVRFTGMPTIPAGSTIDKAEMTIHLNPGTKTVRNLTFYEMTTSWVSKDITWNFASDFGTINPTILAFNKEPYQLPVSRIYFYRICIDPLVNKWYGGSKVTNPKGDTRNYGFRIQYNNESKTNPDYNAIVSAENTNIGYRPIIWISYTGSTPPPTANRTIKDGVYVLRNLKSNRVLDVRRGESASYTPVIQYDFLGGENQLWEFTFASDGYYRISPVHAPKMALQVKGNVSKPVNDQKVEIGVYVPSALAQKWLIERNGSNYVIRPKCDTSMALEINGLANNDPAQIYRYDSNNSKKWAINTIAAVGGMFDDPDGNGRRSSDDNDFSIWVNQDG